MEITCNTCQKEIIVKPINYGATIKCPQCEAYLSIPSSAPPPTRSLKSYFQFSKQGWFFIIIIFICVSTWGFVLANMDLASDPSPTNSGSSQSKHSSSKTTAWVRAQTFVERSLKSPSKADFGYQSAQKQVTELGGNKYRVHGWVDSQNSFGATVRAHFSLVVKDQGGGTWDLVGGPEFIQK